MIAIGFACDLPTSPYHNFRMHTLRYSVHAISVINMTYNLYEGASPSIIMTLCWNVVSNHWKSLLQIFITNSSDQFQYAVRGVKRCGCWVSNSPLSLSLIHAITQKWLDSRGYNYSKRIASQAGRLSPSDICTTKTCVVASGMHTTAYFVDSAFMVTSNKLLFYDEWNCTLKSRWDIAVRYFGWWPSGKSKLKKKRKSKW